VNTTTTPTNRGLEIDDAKAEVLGKESEALADSLRETGLLAMR
jgi:hypothetical protein